jgi:iron(III) transport system substrate-binding protein
VNETDISQRQVENDEGESLVMPRLGRSLAPPGRWNRVWPVLWAHLSFLRSRNGPRLESKVSVSPKEMGPPAQRWRAATTLGLLAGRPQPQMGLSPFCPPANVGLRPTSGWRTQALWALKKNPLFDPKKLRCAPVLFGLFAVLMSGCKPGNSVVVYCAQDEMFAETVFKEFTRATGISVKPLFDSEAVKTVGMANRLLAEKETPRCDLFWSNEELRTRELARRGVFRETNGWFSCGLRRRVLVINPSRLPDAQHPKSLLELTNSQWSGKVAIAYPVFGTTAAHFMALRQRWGESRWADWCRALQANGVRLVDGNSVVVSLVAAGEASIGLTDSDDVIAAKREGKSVAALDLGEDGLEIPNTIALIRAGPNPAGADRLAEYLRGPEVAAVLVKSGAWLDGKSRADAGLDWERLLNEVPRATGQMQQIFLRR